MKGHNHGGKLNFSPYHNVAFPLIVISTIMTVTISCQANNPQSRVTSPGDVYAKKIRSSTGPQIKPGKSIGKIYLGELAGKIESLLGKPSLGDAAMCKSWARWEGGKPGEAIEIFESCDPRHNMQKTVHQIRISAIPFTTKEGISPQSTLKQIQKYFPGLIPEATFKDKTSGQHMIVLDQVQHGIAFVVNSKGKHPDPHGKCHVIIIHPQGKRAIDTYLQPKWQLHPI